MIRWIPYTFIRITLFFIAGIILGIYLPDSIPEKYAEVLLVSLGIAYISFFILSKRINKNIFNPGIIGLFAIVLAGYVHVLHTTERRDPDHLIKEAKPIKYYRVIVTRYTEEKERSWKTEARVIDIYTTGWEKKKGKIVLYFSKDEFPQAPRYGDVFVIKGSPRIVDPPSNPGEFDYKRFLSFRNIYHQHFLRSDDVLFIENDPPWLIMHYAIRARVWADQTLKRFVPGEREQAVASALVLGVTDGLDNELLNAYAATGAMHVLAVSGLHITIIYLIIAWLLKPLNKLRSGPWILAVISLFILWAYAFITGLSPSVLRAVTMFSFIALARPFGLGTNIYNTLAASAFCLLVFDPFLIMSVGFQLSYLAVIGIVYLQPGLYRLWEPQTWFWDEVWKITCVSIAAQVATFALGLLYFHQFPNYFLLSNLLVIPGSFLVLVLGLVVLVASLISTVAQFLGFLLGWLIKILNVIVFTVESFPFSLVENIHITTFQCWVLIVTMIVLILLLEYKRFSYVLLASGCALLFSILQWQHFYQDINIRKFTIYKVPGHSAIDLIDSGHAYFLTDSLLVKDEEKIRFHIRPNRLTSGVDKVYHQDLSFVRQFQGARMIQWNGLLIAHITSRDFILPETSKPDWLIIGNNAVADLTKLPSNFKSAKIILDSSNSFYFTESFLKKSQTMKLDVYSVWHQGAFDFKISTTNT